MQLILAMTDKTQLQDSFAYLFSTAVEFLVPLLSLPIFMLILSLIHICFTVFIIFVIALTLLLLSLNNKFVTLFSSYLIFNQLVYPS